jgi:hypothetical protein
MCRAGGRRCAGASTSRAATRERQRRARARRAGLDDQPTQPAEPRGGDVTSTPEPEHTADSRDVQPDEVGGQDTDLPGDRDVDQDAGRGGGRVINYAAPGAVVGHQAGTIVGDVTFMGATGMHTTRGGGLPADLADHVQAAAEHARAAADRARAAADTTFGSAASARVTHDPGGEPSRLPDDVRDELARRGIQTGRVGGQVWVDGRRIH